MLEWFIVWYKKLISFFFCNLVSLKQLSPSSPQISCFSSFRFVLTRMPCCVRTSKWLNLSPKKNFLSYWDLWRKIWIVRFLHFVKVLCLTQKRFLFDLTFLSYFCIFSSIGKKSKNSKYIMYLCYSELWIVQELWFFL